MRQASDSPLYFDQLLAALVEPQELVIVDVEDIAGSHPSVVEGLSGGFFIVLVAPESMG